MRTAQVTVVPWDPRWPQEFLRIRVQLLALLGPLAAAVEHVGSTAVEGLWAKPILDADVVLRDREALPAAVRALERGGWRWEGDLGIPDRESFDTAQHTELWPHHLYVCPPASAELRRHLALRDYLRAHPEAAAEYSRVKREAAALFPDDIDRYLAYKSAVIAGIYRRCERERTISAEN